MIYTDPPDTFIDKVLENRSSRESFHNIFTSPKDLLSADLNEQIALSQQEHAMFVATGDDPWIEIPVSLEAETVRYCLITMACKVQSDHAEAQLFWSGEKRPGYNEHLSIRIPLYLDGRDHTYFIDLHGGAGSELVNFRWKHPGSIRRIRFDPLNKPGEFSIRHMCFLEEDSLGTDSVRQEIGL